MTTAQLQDNTDQHQTATTQADEEREYVSKVGWRVLFSFTTKRHVPVILGGFVSTAVAALTMPVFAIVYGLIFGTFTLYGGGAIDKNTLISNMTKYCVILAGTTVLNWIANSTHYFCCLTFGEMQARSAHNKIFDALIKKDMAWFDTRETGIAAFLPTVQAHIRDLQLSVSSPLGETAQGIIQCLSALGVAFYFSWKLTLVVLSSLPLLYLALALVANRQALRAQEQSEILQSALKYLTTAITSIETVKCFNGERHELNNFKRITGLAASLYKWVANFRSMQIGLVQFFTFSMFVQGFWYGKHLIDSGENRAADILTTFWAVLMAISSMTQLMPQMVVLQKGKAAGASLNMLMKSISSHDQLESSGQTKPARCVGNIEFRKVTFSYPSRAEEVAIRDASLSIPAGETTFIIGKSGSGKSTLSQLLVRFYQPSSGQIFLDGTPLEDVDVHWLRRNVTLVEQHSVMFNDTIYGNIALGKPDEMLYMQDIHDAVKFAMLEKVVGGLPDGLGTELGIKGGSMSGGQKQRLALARAKIRDSPVLVLDESTSALDYVTRAAVYEALREWRKGKTTIIITHDISQIRADDFLYLLDDTRVVQEGYKKELEAEGGAFLAFLESYEEAEEGTSDADAPEYSEDDVDDSLPVNTGTLAAQRSPMPRPISAILFGQSVSEPVSIRNRESKAIDVATDPTPAQRASDYEHRELRPETLYSYVEGQDPLQVPQNGQPPVPDAFLLKELGMRPDSLTSRKLSWYGSNKRPVSLSKDFGSRTESMLSLQPTSPISLYPQPLAVPDSLPERPKTLKKSQIGRKVLSRVKAMRHKNEADKLGTSTESLPLKDILMSVWPAIGWSSHMMILGVLFFTMVHSACTPVFAWAFARLQSTYQRSSEQNDEARNYSLVILGVAIADGLSMYLMFFLSDAVAQAWSLSLKTEAMRRILVQPREFFDKEENSTSRLAETLDHFAEEARNLPGRFACIFLAIFLMVTISILWSMVISWKLALVALAMGPVLFAITRCNDMISNHWERVASNADDKISEILHETFVNIRTVRCLGLENHFRRKHQAATTEAVKVGVKRAAYCGSIYGLAFAGVIFVATLLYWYGSVLMANDEHTASTIIECFLILMLSVNHVCSMAQYITQVNISRDAGTRLLRLARLPIDSHELTGTTKIESAGDISLEKVNFTYPTRKDVQVLHDMSFSIPRGSCTAIVGSSGSGKSTIASLLLKLYPADDTTSSGQSVGGISISSHDIKTLDTGTLRSHIAIVSQTPVLFPGTIAENITYGLSPSHPETSSASVRAAAQAAGLADFIDSLPHGYTTLVGDGGTGLSGGQAQRLCIARALVRNPDILVLDEATSALDVASAGIIRETILRLVRRGRAALDPTPLSASSHTASGPNSAAGDKQDDAAGCVTEELEHAGVPVSNENSTTSVASPHGKDKVPSKQMTVVIITHAREMMAIAEHIVMLDQGRVVEQGSFSELKRRRGGAFGRLLRGETA